LYFWQKRKENHNFTSICLSFYQMNSSYRREYWMQKIAFVGFFAKHLRKESFHLDHTPFDKIITCWWIWRYCKANLETKERIIGWGKKSCFCFFDFKMMDSCYFAARKFSRIQRDSSNLFWNPSVEHLRKWYEISWLNCAPNSEDWNEIFFED